MASCTLTCPFYRELAAPCIIVIITIIIVSIVPSVAIIIIPSIIATSILSANVAGCAEG